MSAVCIGFRPEQPTLRGFLGCLRPRSDKTADTSRISRLFASASGRNSRRFVDLSVVCVGVTLEQPTLRGSLDCLLPRSSRNNRHFADLSAVCIRVRLEQPTFRGSLGCLRWRYAGTADASRFSRLFASAFEPKQPTLRGSLGCLRLRSAGTADTSRISRLFASAFGRNSRHSAELSVVCVRIRPEQPTLRGALGCLRPRLTGTADTLRLDRPIWTGNPVMKHPLLITEKLRRDPNLGSRLSFLILFD